MKDRRSVDDLSIAELQRVLSEKKRLAREARLARYRETGRALPVIPVGALPPGEADAPAAPPRPRSLGQRLFDAALVVVEVGAVVGLVYILYTGANILASLNRESAQAITQSVAALPTLAPTPIVTAVVLPSGHTPPDLKTGETHFNLAEIPESLRSSLQALPAPAVPTQGPSQARRIVIPALNVDAPIVQGDAWEQLKQGVGQHIGSGEPGQPGNLVLSAHNDIFGEIFRRLDQLQPGDEIQIYTVSQIVTYVIAGTRVVAPTEVSVLAPTSQPSITLISCYPYLVDNQRIVVSGTLKAP